MDRIIATSPGLDILDVGAGTGIAARQFQLVGCKVLGVEPDARMADFARRRGLETEVTTFEAGDPRRNFDAVIAGQAWHWVDPVAGAAKAAQAAMISTQVGERTAKRDVLHPDQRADPVHPTTGAFLVHSGRPPRKDHRQRRVPSGDESLVLTMLNDL